MSVDKDSELTKSGAGRNLVSRSVVTQKLHLRLRPRIRPWWIKAAMLFWSVTTPFSKPTPWTPSGRRDHGTADDQRQYSKGALGESSVLCGLDGRE